MLKTMRTTVVITKTVIGLLLLCCALPFQLQAQLRYDNYVYEDDIETVIMIKNADGVYDPIPIIPLGFIQRSEIDV
jgi:hypothetical protein